MTPGAESTRASEDPSIAGELGAAAIRGLQGADLSDPLRIVACAKHYAGDGGTAWTMRSFFPGRPPRGGLDQGNVEMGEPEFRRLHIAPYLPSFEAGVGTVMPSYSSWNGEKCSGNRHLVIEILKEELGFEGFVISDYNAINQIPVDDQLSRPERFPWNG